MIEYIDSNGEILALIIRQDYHEQGIHFLTDEHYSQQLAYMHHPKGKKIDAHVHNLESRNVIYTQEVLVIRKGKMRVDFYKNNHDYIESSVLNEGDIILLASGGHGFEVLEELEMVEVKQGPYLGERDKTRFDGIEKKNIIIRKKEME